VTSHLLTLVFFAPPVLLSRFAGIKELVQALHDKGVQVFLVSGGFREVRFVGWTCQASVVAHQDQQVIEPIADILKVPRDHIFANRIVFHADGTYKGFDDTEPTSQAGGKAVVVGMYVTTQGRFFFWRVY